MAMTVDKQEILDLIRVQSPRLELISFDAGKSEAWRWFKRVRVDGRVLPYAVCNGCLKPVHYTPRDGTGGLRRHACALTMAMQSQNLAASTHKTGPGTQVLASTPANGSQRQRGGGGGSTTSLSDVTRNLVASRKNNHNLGRDLSNSYRHQLETAQQSHNAALPPAKRARPSKNNRTLANTNPGLVAPSLMLWAAQQGLVDLASTASLANMDLRALLPVSSIASMASMASTMASLNAKYSAVMASNGGSSPSPNWAADEGSQRESKSSAGKSRHESGGGSSSPNERTLHGHGNGSNSCSSTPSTTPVPLGGNPSSFNGMNVPKSMSKISDIALDLAQKVNAESTTPMNLSQDYMASQVPMRRPRKRSHPDRAVPSALPSSSPPALMSLANGNYTTVQVPPHHSYSNVCTENGDELNRERLTGEDLSRASLLRLSLEAKKHEERTGNVEENEPVNEASMEDYEEEEDEQKQPLDLQQVIPRRSSDVKVETQVPVPTQQSSSLSNLGALNHAQLSPPLRTVHMNQISVLTDAIDTLLPVTHDKIKREVSTTPMKCESLAINQPLLCQEATLSTSSSYALNELLGQLSHLIQRHKELLSTLEPSEPEVTMPVIPEIQKPAPQFRGIAVVDGQFKEISLADYAGKYVILFFYPLDFTFVCPTEIIAFSDRAEEFRQIGCEVIACSTDSHFSHLAWVNTPRKQGGLGSMNIPLLADKATVVSKAYGVYKEDEGLTFRGLFIIDDKQRLRQITINDLPVGRSVDETLRLVQAFQFTDKHGEVCPAGWKPGSKTMKADPSGSKEYFEGQH